MIDVEKLKLTLTELAPKYGLKAAILFGSQARGDTNRESDIDIAIKADKVFSPLEIGEIAFQICRRIHRDDIEIAQLSQLSPIFLRQIADEGIVLFQNDSNFFAEFAMYAYQLYWEAKKLYNMRHQYLQEKLSKL